MYDSFDLKNKIIHLKSKTYKVGTPVCVFERKWKFGINYIFISTISNITEKSVILDRQNMDGGHKEIVPHESFAIQYG